MGMRWLLVLAVVTVMGRGEDTKEEILSEVEQHWEHTTLEVLNAIAKSHGKEMEEMETASAEDEAGRKRLTRNVAVSIYRLIMTHPLGDGKARVRKVFSQSDLKRVFFWDDLFPPGDDLLPEDEDL